ncbi:MAG: tryptophan 7-halogenase [Pirellulales bacterium]|nr:tryptophan 7-halogenase [Pirellulales bacterium]
MNPQSRNIESIIIVGGGTAAWMTAAYLGKFLENQDVRIRVVESSASSAIGVGEASLPTLIRFLRNLGFDEYEFIKYCGATYKLAIEFAGWTDRRASFWHPFGVTGPEVNHLDFFHAWLKHRNNPDQSFEYSDYSIHKKIAEAKLGPTGFRDASNIITEGSYAYHFDTGAFIDFLKVKSIELGVLRIVDAVDDVEIETNQIARLQCKSGKSLEADLYIDCTGFEAVLIEPLLDSEYLSYGNRLLCDTAIVCELPVDEELRCSTRSSALSAGWMWDIPLRDRRGAGYVFSSTFTDTAEAVKEFKSAVSLDPNFDAIREIPMKIGRRSSFWTKNCLAIGLAAGFLEPLESTGLHLIQTAIELFMDHFPDKQMNSSLQSNYNRLVTTQFDQISDFIQLHYYLSKGNNSPFWLAARQAGLSSELENRIELYLENGLLGNLSPLAFPSSSYYHILSGNEIFPRRPAAAIEMMDQRALSSMMENIPSQITNVLNNLPSHRTLISYINSVSSN